MIVLLAIFAAGQFSKRSSFIFIMFSDAGAMPELLQSTRSCKMLNRLISQAFLVVSQLFLVPSTIPISSSHPFHQILTIGCCLLNLDLLLGLPFQICCSGYGCVSSVAARRSAIPLLTLQNLDSLIDL
jgi:hypothetical protein